MDKSYVSLEQHVCPVCGTTFDTGNILFDRRLVSKMDRHTVTAFELCPEHMQLFNDGFVALVECDPQRSNIQADTNQISPSEVYRTGRIAHLKRDKYAQVFNVPIKDSQPLVFVGTGVIEQLQAMTS